MSEGEDDGNSLVSDEKHVTVNEEPEVFTFRPDTLEVEKQEKPKPLDPSEEHELSVQEMAGIIKQIEDYIEICEETVIEQKLTNAKIGFILMRIAESVDEYDVLMGRLIRFLVNADDVTSKYFIDICERLPAYGDFVSTIDNITDSYVKIDGMDGVTEKSAVQNVAKNIQKNTYNGGLFLGSFRAVSKVIGKHMRERRDATEHIKRQIESWIGLTNSTTQHLDKLRDRLYDLSVYHDFVRSGDARIQADPSSDYTPKTMGSVSSKLEGIPKSLGNLDRSSVEDSKEESANSSFSPIFHSTPVSYERSGITSSIEDSFRSSANTSFRPAFHSTPVSYERGSVTRSTEGSYSIPATSSFDPGFHSTPVSYERSSVTRSTEDSSMPWLPHSMPEISSFDPGFHSTPVSYERGSVTRSTEDSSMPWLPHSMPEISSFDPGFHSTPVSYERDSVTRSTEDSSMPEISSFDPGFHSTPVSHERGGVTRSIEDSDLSSANSSFSPGFHSTPVSYMSGGVRNPLEESGEGNKSFRPEFHSTPLSMESDSFLEQSCPRRK